MSNSTLVSGMEEMTNAIDSLWIMICGILVFFMQAGFAMLEVEVSELKMLKISYLKIY